MCVVSAQKCCVLPIGFAVDPKVELCVCVCVCVGVFHYHTCECVLVVVQSRTVCVLESSINTRE